MVRLSTASAPAAPRARPRSDLVGPSQINYGSDIKPANAARICPHIMLIKSKQHHTHTNNPYFHDKCRSSLKIRFSKVQFYTFSYKQEYKDSYDYKREIYICLMHLHSYIRTYFKSTSSTHYKLI